MNPNLFQFIGGNRGEWRVRTLSSITGESLPNISKVSVKAVDDPDFLREKATAETGWILKGFASNERYVTKQEREVLRAIQQPSGRPHATAAAMISIRKTESWWGMAQDERREIIEEVSHHNAIGMKYLPEISRKLYHCRDLGEPFDFITWFEFDPTDEEAFNRLLVELRATIEWTFVDRELDIRVEKSG